MYFSCFYPSFSLSNREKNKNKKECLFVQLHLYLGLVLGNYTRECGLFHQLSVVNWTPLFFFGFNWHLACVKKMAFGNSLSLSLMVQWDLWGCLVPHRQNQLVYTSFLVVESLSSGLFLVVGTWKWSVRFWPDILILIITIQIYILKIWLNRLIPYCIELYVHMVMVYVFTYWPYKY